MYNYQKPVEVDVKRQKFNEQPKVIVDQNTENESPNSNINENSQDSVINVDKDDSQPPTQVTPPTTQNSSAFYPYVDPLHFFIDLRVSAGQVYDRKREAYLSSLKNNNLIESWNNPIISKNRVGSAFKIPGSSEANNHFSAVNLISNNNDLCKKKKSDADSESEKNEDDVEIQVFDVDQKSDERRHENE
jgi:hypothetical protein